MTEPAISPKRARRTALMKESGPYAVYSSGDGILSIVPTWGQFPELPEDMGGGPGLLSRMALAGDIERFLNGVDDR